MIRTPRAIEWRTNGEDTIRERFIRAQTEGDLPADADPAILARYIVIFAYGISVQATTGVPREGRPARSSAPPSWAGLPT